MQPSKIEYQLGRTRYQQQLVLEREGEHWTLIQHAVNQRDETQRIHLSAQQLRDIGEHFRTGKQP